MSIFKAQLTRPAACGCMTELKSIEPMQTTASFYIAVFAATEHLLN